MTSKMGEDDIRRQGFYSVSGKTPYRQFSWSLEAARLDATMVISLWNLTAYRQRSSWGACQISQRLEKSKK